MPKLHFISGLPRSGSTMLSAILRQNPHFHAGMSSPVAPLISSILPKMSGTAEFAPIFNDSTRYNILRGIFSSYYYESADDAVIFDTSRGWTAKMSLINQLYPDSRIICCVREIGWILDSLERAQRKNPSIVSKLTGDSGKTVYGRIESLMNPETGMVGFAWSALREAWFSEFAKKLIILPYNDLASAPEYCMRQVYESINEPYFPHQFDNLEYNEDAFDDALGTPGLHTVRARVELIEREPCIPPDIFMKYTDTHFWMNPKLNTKGATIIRSTSNR